MWWNLSLEENVVDRKPKTTTSKPDTGSRADPREFEEGAVEQMVNEGGHGDDPDTRGYKERGMTLVPKAGSN